MLSLREKVIVLFATAPDGFAATARELRKKFNVSGQSSFAGMIWRLEKRGILKRQNRLLFAGPVLKQELGADE